MHKTLKFFLFVALASSLFFFPAKMVFSLEDSIIAVVNDDLVTLKDLKDYFHSIYIQLKMEGKTDQEIDRIISDFKTEGIEKLIEDKLILSKANEVGIQINEDTIDERLKMIKSRYPSEQEFIDSLILGGATVTDLRNKIRDQLKMKGIVELKVKSKISINPQEVTDFYNANLEKFYQPEGRDLDSIYLSTRDDAAKAKQKAAKALALLEEGKPFEEIAKEYSETPSVGIVTKGQFLSSIEETVFKLDEGELSPIIEVDGGIFIFKIKSKVPMKLVSLEEAKNKVKDMLFHSKFKNNFKNWIEDIKRDAFIEINE